MRKKNIIRLLRNADDEMIEQISEKYPALTDFERDELFDRIEQNLRTEQPSKNISEAEEQYILTNKRHSSRIFPAMSAAACILLLCGTFAVHFFMRGDLQPELSESTDTEIKYDYSIGESYAVDNLTKSGKLLVTVTDAELDGELYHVCVKLESKNAVSFADDSSGEPYLFMADNFMGAVGQKGENWVTVQPCRIECGEEQCDIPNAIILRPHEECELELWFRKKDIPDEWKLVTNNSTEYPYTIIKTKEN